MTRLPAAVLSLGLEAVRAVHGLIATRYERNLRFFATGRTDCGMHLTSATTHAAVHAGSASCFALGSASRASGGRIGETLLRVELLFARCKHKVHVTVAAGQCFVFVAQVILLDSDFTNCLVDLEASSGDHRPTTRTRRTPNQRAQRGRNL